MIKDFTRWKKFFADLKKHFVLYTFLEATKFPYLLRFYLENVEKKVKGLENIWNMHVLREVFSASLQTEKLLFPQLSIFK